MQAVESLDLDIARPLGPEIHRILRECRDRSRITEVRYQRRTAYLLTHYDDVAAAFRSEAEIPAAAAYRVHSEPAQGHTVLCMEGDAHRLNRALVFPPFAPKAVRAYADTELVPLAHRLVDEMLGGDGDADLVASFTHEFAFRFILHMLGIPPDDHPSFHEWSLALLNYAYKPDQALRAKQQFTEYLQPLVDERRRHPGDDLLSVLANGEVEGSLLGDEEIFSFARLLFPAGADTSYLGQGNLFYALLTTPGALDRVREDPEARPLAIEEALRWEPPAALLPRRTQGAVEIGGVEIPGDTELFFGIAAANRDPQRYDDPDRFDIDRHPTGLMTFGLGTHFCLGAHLARAEMVVALDVICDRLDDLALTTTDDVRVVGSILRGPNRLPVLFTAR